MSNTLPSRADLLADLRRLQQVSVALESLTGRLGEGQPLHAAARAELERLTVEQARLVDGFVVLAGEGPTVDHYRDATRVFQADMQALRRTDDPQAVQALSVRISNSVELWVGALEHLIRDVVARAL